MMATANETSLGMQITISQVSKLESIYSSGIIIHGIPWTVEIFKKEGNDNSEEEEEDKTSLGVRLICANKDNSLEWSISAAASWKLLPFSTVGKH